jgi:glycolate oxidase
MLELLEDEVVRCLGLLGVTQFSNLNRSYLHRAEATTAPHALSAFPLLSIPEYTY